MADPKTTQTRPLSSSRRIAPIVTVAVVAAVGVAVALNDVDPNAVATTDPVAGEREARSTGAGTMPDGVADTLGGGLGTGSRPGDFVLEAQDADLVGPLLEVPNPTPPQARTAGGLEPIDGSDGPIVEQIEAGRGMEIDTSRSDGG